MWSVVYGTDISSLQEAYFRTQKMYIIWWSVVTYFLIEKSFFPWTDLTCLLKLPCVLLAYRQNGQEKGLCLKCIVMCLSRWNLVWNSLLHTSHKNCRGWWTVFIWAQSRFFTAKNLPQVLQLKQKQTLYIKH